ncbi:MAG: bifunctional glutamate N-acetyltransferase/amino-acid acetyltransferase ArgJ [Actinomycetia bacterium]|nr:bifunctional glutamate N-acetyltransferase/amino-acid acetyltransferase ArgJ [Actinomycetes bacterium]
MGVKNADDDLMIVAADRAVPTVAMLTRSLWAGPSVVVTRDHAADLSARAVVMVSKNANVATGPEGRRNTDELVELTAVAVGCDRTEVLVASTGVIGVPYPMPVIRTHFDSISWPEGATASAEEAATAIMTTDTHEKVAEAVVSGSAARVVGIAKGVGMIEPDMATMLTLITTDAEVAATDLEVIWRRVVARTFNSLSIDTDTSTSDTAIVMANGEAGPVDLGAFEAALGGVALDLTRQLAYDGEGAETLIVVTVDGARDDAQAKRVAKAIVNSPLVKTAVHGRDPNWGRIAMAVGKCSDETDISPDHAVIRIGGQELYPSLVSDDTLAQLEQYLAADEVLIRVSLGIADGAWTVYGCDLTDGYVRINADYTT